MGLQIGDIVPRKSIQLSELKGKTICVDAFNTLYQFISTIRQPDGTPLMDKNKRVTSHLSGLFYRNMSLILEGIKLVYVFDGKPPELKKRTGEIRRGIKEEARENYNKAKQDEDVEAMGKFSRQLSFLNDEMIQESKDLLKAMGAAVVQAPGEGESQASYLAKRDAYAVGSQDYDSLLFGAPRLIQNLTLASRRKTASGYVFISPEMIELEKLLNSLQINMDQLISLGILTGTDYNPGGIRGIGQKRALQIVKQFKHPAAIFNNFKEQIDIQDNSFDWQEIFALFKSPDIDKNTKLEFSQFDSGKVKEILMKRDFSESRIDNQLKKLEEFMHKKKQKGLKDFF